MLYEFWKTCGFGNGFNFGAFRGCLLGVAKEDLIRDYELSAFYYNYAHVNRNVQTGGNVLVLLERLEALEGETLADKTATFLLSVGVTEAEIASIRSIFLD